jgi:farnesyl-diphosphate farnesyltransferase
MKLDEAWAYCKKMLPLVSRTFALNIGHLNGVLHRAVLIGYLLFRIADTIEDSIDLTQYQMLPIF